MKRTWILITLLYALGFGAGLYFALRHDPARPYRGPRVALAALLGAACFACGSVAVLAARKPAVSRRAGRNPRFIISWAPLCLVAIVAAIHAAASGMAPHWKFVFLLFAVIGCQAALVFALLTLQLRLRETPSKLFDAALCLVVSVGFSLAAAETGLRLIGGIGYGRGDDPAIAMERGFYRHNSLGFRDKEWSVEKAKGAFRLIVLGDSFAWGQGVEEENTFPRVLESLLNERQCVEVCNSGRSGLNTVQEVELLEDHLLVYDPDFVLLQFCLNDAEEEGYSLPRLLPARAARAFGWSYLYFAARFAYSRALIALGRWPDYHEYISEQYLPNSESWQACQEAVSRLAQLSAQKGFGCAVVVFPIFERTRPYTFLEETSQIVDAAVEAGLPVPDLFPVYEDWDFDELAVSRYDRHPNATAHRVAAEALDDFLKEQEIL